MSDSKHLPRLYDEAEVGKILDRATAIQRQEPVRASGRSGLSLAELEEIALETGIDPKHLRRAALELDTGEIESTFGTRLRGEQTTLAMESTVAGELPDDAYERLVLVIQRGAKEHGQPSLLGRTLTWRAETANKTRTIQVIVSARRGETHIRVEERLHQFAAGLFGGVMGGVGGGVGLGVGIPIGLEVLGSALFATAFPLGIVALSYIGCREIYRAFVKRRRAALGELLAQVTESVADATAERSLDTPARPPEIPRG
jgi:hypothetical protein